MRIGIDATPLILKRSGVGYYTKNLVEQLINFKDDFELALFISSLRGQSGKLEKEFDSENVKVIHSRIPARALVQLWSKTRSFPVENLIGMIDIFHATNYLLPFLKKAKGIITIHDLGFIRFPEFCQKETLKYRDLLPLSIKRATKIISVSEFTRHEIIELLGVKPEKIVVTHQGYGTIFNKRLKPDELNYVLGKYNLKMGEIILFVGTVEPRKNLSKLIDAFDEVKVKKSINHKLVIAGGLGWSYDEFLKKKAASKFSDDIILTGYISGKELLALYRLASCFVFPSLYEGFGLPVLEAMVNSTPVVCSKRSSLPEIAGDAAVYFNPDDAEDIANKIIRVLEDTELKNRLISSGKKQVRKYSWKKSVEKTVQIYKHVNMKGGQ